MTQNTFVRELLLKDQFTWTSTYTFCKITTSINTCTCISQWAYMCLLGNGHIGCWSVSFYFKKIAHCKFKYYLLRNHDIEQCIYNRLTNHPTVICFSCPTYPQCNDIICSFNWQQLNFHQMCQKNQSVCPKNNCSLNFLRDKLNDEQNLIQRYAGFVRKHTVD